jgi:hypothetical protein
MQTPQHSVRVRSRKRTLEEGEALLEKKSGWHPPSLKPGLLVSSKQYVESCRWSHGTPRSTFLRYAFTLAAIPRYFVDKFPMFLASPLPVVTFTYIHDGELRSLTLSITWRVTCRCFVSSQSSVSCTRRAAIRTLPMPPKSFIPS